MFRFKIVTGKIESERAWTDSKFRNRDTKYESGKTIKRKRLCHSYQRFWRGETEGIKIGKFKSTTMFR